MFWRPIPPKERTVDEDRMPGPRDVKVLKFSKRGGQRPEIKQLRVLGNQRLTSGGQIKRAKPKQSPSKSAKPTDPMPGHGQIGHERHIICMKWGKKYGPEYVNRLYAMVRRHLSGDFRFVCLTDDASGIRSEVECKPIPPLVAPGIPERGWTKLVTFSADLYGLRGTALFLDVDVVVTGSLDDFFTQPGEFLIIHDYKRHGALPAIRRCTVLKLGAPRCAEYFRGHFAEIRQSSANEQAYLSDFCTNKASCSTGPQAGVPVSNTTAFLPGPPILEGAVCATGCAHRDFSW